MYVLFGLVILADIAATVLLIRQAYRRGVAEGRGKFMDHRCPKGHQYRIGCLDCGSPAMKVTVSDVPAGTFTLMHPKTEAEERARQASIRRVDRLDPGHSLMCDCDRCLEAFGG